LLAAIDEIDAGFAVFDDQLRLLFCNTRYILIRGYPPELCRPGATLAELFRFNALRADYGAGDTGQQVAERIAQIARGLPIEVDQVLGDGRILEARYRPLTDGGLATTYRDVTELRRTAAALHEEGERHELVSEAVSEGIYDWNIASNTLEVSDRLNQIFNFARNELTASDWGARVHPDDMPPYSAAMRQHFSGKTPVLSVAYRIRDKTGAYRWVEDHAKAIRNEAGRAVRLVGAIADITSRKEAEQALQASEERYALAMSAINEGIYDFDLERNQVFYSPSVHRAMGFTAAEMSTPEDWIDRIHPEDLPLYRKSLAAHLRGEAPRFVCEFRYLHSDGTLHWARQHGTAVRDPRGRAVRLVGSTGDISAEKTLAAELDKARTRLSESLESISQGFALFDVEDRLVMCNSTYRRFFAETADPEVAAMLVPGMMFEDYVRKAYEKGMYPDAGPDLEAYMQARLARRRAGSAFELRLKNGTWLYVTERRTHEGGLVAIYTDISDVKRREAELQAARNHAEAAVVELRRAQDRLVHSEKLASLGQLTAGIAHEIKNPLNFVNNFADLSVDLVDELRAALDPGKAPLDDATRADVDELTEMLSANLTKISQHGRRADGIVKNMLLHSRESGSGLQKIDLNASVEESLALAYHGARAEKPGFNMTLEKDLDEAVGEIELYPQEFTRVLLNLISNGFYAAHQRKLNSAGAVFEPTLRVATRSLGEQVEIRIRDNGTGIPEAVKAKMFNPFFTTKPAGEGTGLGLSLSFDIVVKQHGGRIDVDTRPDEFTEFVVTLPRRPTDGPETEEHAQRSNRGQGV